MTSSEVVWFINHKYGEQAYVVETEKQVLVFTAKSKWIVQKDDKKRFGFYTLFHFNLARGEGFHVQMRGRNIDFLVWCALTHDMEEFYTIDKWNDFIQSWELFQLGQECEERAALFKWFSD